MLPGVPVLVCVAAKTTFVVPNSAPIATTEVLRHSQALPGSIVAGAIVDWTPGAQGGRGELGRIPGGLV